MRRCGGLGDTGGVVAERSVADVDRDLKKDAVLELCKTLSQEGCYLVLCKTLSQEGVLPSSVYDIV
jgi:hypothetical protein